MPEKIITIVKDATFDALFCTQSISPPGTNSNYGFCIHVFRSEALHKPYGLLETFWCFHAMLLLF